MRRRKQLLHKPKAEPGQRISVRVTDEDVQTLNEIIDHEQQTGSEIIRAAITYYWLKVMKEPES